MTQINNEAQLLWKPISSHPSYEVSNQGGVRINKNGKYKDIKTSLFNKRYRYRIFSAYKNGKRKNIFLHRAMLEAFVRPSKNGEMCRHIDGDSSNNTLDNLTWGTNSENQLDSVKHGTCYLKSTGGELKHNSVLKEHQVLEIRKLIKTKKQKDIAEIYGVTVGTISAIITGRSWRCLK